MLSFVSNRRGRTRRPSQLALAIALATGTALAFGSIAAPAYAQRLKSQENQKETKRKKESASKSAYSKEFIEAYKPIETAVNTAGADLSGVPAMFPAMLALAVSPDEKMAAGNVIYNTGVKTQQQPLQMQGMELMLSSGKVAPEQLGQFNFVAYQLANAQGKYADSRAYLQKAIDANFVTTGVGPWDLRIAMAESFVSEGRYSEGLEVMRKVIAEKKASGEPVEESWYRRGLSVGYNNKQPQVYDIAARWLEDYPSQTNWRDAINIARNLNDFDAGATLDMLRLGLTVDALQNKQDYIEYIDSADARRLPKEVETVINNGYAKGRISKDDIYVADQLKIATGRIASDRAELPALEKDARAPAATLRTVVAAGDAFLNYGDNSKAAEFYAKALGMPGVDSALVTTRLGIVQARQGKYAEAQESFGKVQGIRAPIARLWSAYVNNEAAKAAPAAPTAG